MRYFFRFMLGVVFALFSFLLPVSADSQISYQDFRSYTRRLGDVFPKRLSTEQIKQWTDFLLRMYLWTKDSFEVQQEPEQEVFLKNMAHFLEKLEGSEQASVIPEQDIRALQAAFALLRHNYQQAQQFVSRGPQEVPALRLISALLGEKKSESSQYWKISQEPVRALIRELPDSVLIASVLVESFLETSDESDAPQQLLQEADSLLQRMLRQEPNNLFLRYQRAQVYYLSQRKDLAYREFKELLSLQQADYRVSEAVGNFYVWTKEDVRAAEAYERSWQLNPYQPRLYQKLEQVYLRLEVPLKAVRLYLKGLELQPTQRGFYQALKDLIPRTDLDEMLKLFKQGKVNSEKNVYLLIFQADLYALKEDWNQALSLYRQALEVQPVSMIAHENLLQLLWKQQDFTVLKLHLEKIRQQPGVLPFTHYWMGLLYLQNQEPAQAVAELEKASLKDMSVRHALVAAYRQNKQLDKAKALLQEMLRENSKDIQLLIMMGDIYVDEKNLAKAEEYYLWAHKLEPYNASVHFSLGNLYSDTGRSQLAQQFFERVILMNPADLDARNNLGNVLLKEKKFKEAVQHFKMILRMNPEYATAYYNIACAYALTRQKDAALRYLQKALERDQQLKSLATHDPDLDSLRQDSFFQKLVK